MFFIANAAFPGSQVPAVFGPYKTEDEAKLWAGKLQPGNYVIYGPGAALHNFTVAAPVVTMSPANG